MQIHFLQQLLVIVQFTIATILIISMIVIQKQSKFLQDFNTGFNKEETFFISLNSQIKDKKLFYKEELSKISGVEGVSLCNGMPGVGIPDIRFDANNKSQNLDYFNVDDDYFRVMQINLKIPVMPDLNSCWINEAAAKSLNYDPDKKSVIIDLYGKKVTCLVNEVLPDMNFRSLYEPCKLQGARCFPRRSILPALPAVGRSGAWRCWPLQAHSMPRFCVI
jgi:putative ABC transport system permease protein